MTRDEAIVYISGIVSKYDPAIDTSVGSAAYYSLIIPLVNKFTSQFLDRDVESFIMATFRDAFPDVDVTSSGSGYRDLFVKPLMLFMNVVKTEAISVKHQQSFADEDRLSLPEARALAANLGVSDAVGDYAYGTVQVYFSAPRVVSLDPSIVFTAKTGEQFVPTEVKTLVQTDFIRAGQQFYIQVPVRSVAQTKISVPRGTINTVTGLAGALRISNNSSINGGTPGDTSASLRSRSLRGLNERSLNTHRGIESSIFENFSNIISVRVVGFGDAEMTRDLLAVNIDFAADETVPGGVVAVPTSWYSLPLTDDSLTGTNVVPFTNRIFVSGLSEEEKAAIQSAGYLNLVAPASLGFRSKALSRMRKIASVAEVDSGLLVTVADFTVFPTPSAARDGVVETHNCLHSTARRSAFNAYSSSGEAGMLVRVVDDVEKVIGAPLPVSDWLDVSTMQEIPASVMPGRDFIVVASNDTFETSENVFMPSKLLAYPAKEFVRGRKVRVGRLDSFLLSADRSAKLSDAITPENSNFNSNLTVVAAGVPAFEDEDLRYSGTDKADYARNPGVSLSFSKHGDGHRATVQRHASLPAWETIGVYAGDFISLCIYADNDTPFDGSLTNVDAYLSWSGSGRILAVDGNSLLVGGMTADLLTDVYDEDDLAGFSKEDKAFPDGSPYRCAWSVYRGSERVSSGDSFYLQYYDQTYPQAAHFDGAPYPRGQGFKRSGKFGYVSGLTSSAALGSDVWNDGLTVDPTLTRENKSFWLRLDRSFFDYLADFAETLQSAEMTLSSTSTDAVTIGFEGGDAKEDADATRADRYEYFSLNVNLWPGDEDVLVTRTILPYADAAKIVTFDGDDLSAGGVMVGSTPPTYNPKAHAGFFIPYPAGPDWPAYWVATDDFPPLESTAEELDEALGGVHPTLVFYESVSSTSREVTPSIGNVTQTSSIQGPGGALFEDGEIHIGGMTDVYVAGALQNAVAAGLTAYPESATDIKKRCLDGVLAANTPSIIQSDSGVAFFEEIVASSSSPEAVGEYSILIRNAALLPAVTPLSVRVSHISDLGIHLESPLHNLPESVSGVIFDIVSELEFSITNSVELVASGSGAAVQSGSLQVRIPAPHTIHLDEKVTLLTLEITHDGALLNAGILAISGTVITIDIAFSVTGTFDYRIIRRQSASVLVPVAMIDSVSTAVLSDGVGSVIPYAKPLGGSIIGASAISNDRIEGSSVGEAALGIDKETGFLRMVVSGADWAALGVIENDIVVLFDTEDPTGEFFVTEIADDTLVLDRALEKMVDVSVDYYVAHPSFATVQLYFKDKTRLILDSESTIATSDGIITFRASYLETGTIVKPRVTEVMATIIESDSVGKVRVDLSVVNILAANVAVGQHIALVSNALISTITTTDDTLFNVNNKALHLLVSGTRRAVVFTGVTSLSPSEVIVQFNRQMATEAKMDLDEDGKLRVLSSNAVTILDSGSAGILSILGFDLAVKNNSVPESILTEYKITAMAFYGEDKNTVDLTVQKLVDGTYAPASELAALDGIPVFFRIFKKGSQIVYPADMSVAPNGLFTCSVYVSSRRVVEAVEVVGRDVTVSGFQMDGYTLLAANNSFSGSIYENMLMRLSSSIPEITAVDATSSVSTAGLRFDIAYRRCASVADIQSFMLLPATRVVCNNPLVRCFALAKFVVGLTSSTMDSTLVAETIQEFVRSRYPARPISVFELTRALSRLVQGSFDTPLTIGALQLTLDREFVLSLSQATLYFSNVTHLLDDLTYVVPSLLGEG